MSTDIQDETELRGTVVCGERSYLVPLDVKKEVDGLRLQVRALTRSIANIDAYVKYQTAELSLQLPAKPAEKVLS